MGGPGSEGLLERCDGQIQVRPRPGWWRPPNVEGEVGGLGQARYWCCWRESPASPHLAGPSRPWAETLLRPPGALRKDRRGRPASQPMRVRVLKTNPSPRAYPLSLRAPEGKLSSAHTGEAQRDRVTCLRPHRKDGAGI